MDKPKKSRKKDDSKPGDNEKAAKDKTDKSKKKDDKGSKSKSKDKKSKSKDKESKKSKDKNNKVADEEKNGVQLANKNTEDIGFGDKRNGAAANGQFLNNKVHPGKKNKEKVETVMHMDTARSA